jgi:Gas vesicle protein K
MITRPWFRRTMGAMHRLLERQAIRRMEAGSLSAAQAEDVGRALMLLDEAIRELAARFGLEPADLNLDLGPLGKLI